MANVIIKQEKGAFSITFKYEATDSAMGNDYSIYKSSFYITNMKTGQKDIVVPEVYTPDGLIYYYTATKTYPNINYGTQFKIECMTPQSELTGTKYNYTAQINRSNIITVTENKTYNINVAVKIEQPTYTIGLTFRIIQGTVIIQGQTSYLRLYIGDQSYQVDFGAGNSAEITINNIGKGTYGLANGTLVILKPDNTLNEIPVTFTPSTVTVSSNSSFMITARS